MFFALRILIKFVDDLATNIVPTFGSSDFQQTLNVGITEF